MIPKILHYCWFGNGEKPELVQKCMESWRNILPEYELHEWNERNFDLNVVPYVREAYEKKRWAFVTDYVRLYALYNVGGIYVDTDVEILRPLDRFLSLPAFSGFQCKNCCVTGLMGAARHSQWAKDLMDDYTGRHFLNKDGTLNEATNVHYISERMMQMGMKLDGSKESIEGYYTVFPEEYFCPKECVSGKLNLTENSYAIHHFAGSWLGTRRLKLRALSRRFPLLAYYLGYFMRDPRVVVKAMHKSLKRKFYKILGKTIEEDHSLWTDEV